MEEILTIVSLSERITETKQSIIKVSELLEKTVTGLNELTNIVHRMLEEKVNGE